MLRKYLVLPCLLFLSFPQHPLSPSPVFVASQPVLCPLSCEGCLMQGLVLGHFKSVFNPSLVLLGRTSQSQNPAAVSGDPVGICVLKSNFLL